MILKLTQILLLTISLIGIHPVLAEESCHLEQHELSPGVTEIVFPDMRIKLEPASGIFKLKGIGIPGVVEDWTSANIEANGKPSQISGFFDNNGSKYLFAQVIVDRHDSSLDWAIFRSEKLTKLGSEGTAYFLSRGEERCIKVSNQKWNDARRKIFKEDFFDSSGIVVPYRKDF